jgi:hypothetical protein
MAPLISQGVLISEAVKKLNLLRRKLTHVFYLDVLDLRELFGLLEVEVLRDKAQLTFLDLTWTS